MENSNSFSQSPQPGIFADKKLIILMIGAVLLVLFFVFLAFITLSAKPRKPVAIQPVATPTPVLLKNVNQIQPGKTKLSETVYGSFAHKVFPGPISSEDKVLLKDFTITNTPNPDGSTKIKVVFPVSGYDPIEVTVRPENQVFFVYNKASNDYGDNFIVLTDMQGNIIEN